MVDIAFQDLVIECFFAAHLPSLGVDYSSNPRPKLCNYAVVESILTQSLVVNWILLGPPVLLTHFPGRCRDPHAIMETQGNLFVSQSYLQGGVWSAVDDQSQHVQ